MSLKLHIDVKILALTLCVLPVLLSLGFWQLNRAEEKRTIQTAFEKQKKRSPMTWRAIENIKAQKNEKAQLAFLPVTLTGEFDRKQTFLLDNKIYQGKVGYQVLQPFLIQKEKQWVLIKRGWIAAPRTREEKPIVPQPAIGTTTLQAEVYVPPGEAYKLDEQNYGQVTWPLVIQNVEIEKISQLLNKSFFQYEIRLQETDANILQTNWQPISVQPEKHVAYAFQWFAMATGLILWFIFASTNVWQVITRRSESY